MTLKQKSFHFFHTMSITTRFSAGIGLLLALMVTISLTGYLSIFAVRNADNAIAVSTDIQRMVLAMDRGMEKARRLNADFFLQYPTIGLGAAHELYAQPSVRQVAQVISTSRKLKNLIDRSPVSEALVKSQVNLNLYLSSAKRFADTSIQSVELVTDLVAPNRGLEARLDRYMEDLSAEMTSSGMARLYTVMRSHVQDYRINRQRFLMQSAFNAAFQLQQAIDNAPGVQSYQKQRIDDLLTRFITTAEKIMTVQAAIKSKFNDFALQAKAVAPISTILIELANTEVKQARTRIDRANKTAISIMAVITLAGLALAGYIARVLNISITRRVVRLTKAAAKIRKGNLDAFADEKGKDELSELAHTFNVMASRIKGLVDHLELEVTQRTAELAESRDRFRDLFEHSSSGVAIYRPLNDGENFIFEDVNKALETIEQVKRDDIIGKKVTDIFPAVKEFGLLDVFRQVAKTGRSTRHPVNFYSDNRLQGWRENSVYKLPSGEIVAIYDDLTAQKQAEIEKNAMERQLHQARKMEAIGVLAGGIAHDFNNILGIILGNTELAIKDIPKWSPSAHNLEEIRTASLRARDVIRQLLSFSRKTELQKRPVSIISMIKESLTLMRASIPANITIEQDISEDSGAIVADPTQIHQVIINLCTNAAHAMEGDGGILHISAARIHINGSNIDLYPDVEPGPYLQLVVKDTGSGMPPDIKQRIFDPYFTTREVGKGSGMGLAVVHGIVQNHGGAIAIDSEPGQGSTFAILFPAAEPDCLVEAPAPNPVITGGSERILLVDDETALLEITRSFLERHGYDVKSTADPAEALELFVANPDDFDLVITDMAMPNITGVELSKKIILIQPDMPVILCSGYSDAINAQQAIEIGIRSYVEKPVKLSVLEERIRQVLDDAYEKVTLNT
jgi:signal transduction histidine kinase/ActR/RegA family two-component response regulator/HAMP domain-containing protein